jgi:hypothetical protein
MAPGVTWSSFAAPVKLSVLATASKARKALSGGSRFLPMALNLAQLKSVVKRFGF